MTFVVDFSRSPSAVLRPVPVGAVTLAGSFWGPRLQCNAKVTLPSQYALLESTGRLNNFRRVTGDFDGPYAGIFFNDSDVYKWIEAASWAQAAGPIAALQQNIDAAIALIEAAQGEDGYINTHFSLERKHERWSNLRDLHEMYCGGHLIQAAVAHHRVTGNARLLTVARRFADLLCEVFGPAEQGKRVMVDGHEEIEMALIELARETGEPRYLKQAEFFIDARGHGLLHSGRMGLDYFQDDQPIRAMTCLCGHAVRALYMACGVTDLVLERDDPALLDKLESLWTQLTRRRMYISGGMGSRYEGEALGKDFELPNARAYTETCAAIGSMMWCHRMLAATANARYADLLEWTLYNGMLPGWGLDGRHYFYVNPLADDGAHHRQPWYDVACCPPNLARTLAELPGYAYSIGTSADAIWVHLFIEGAARIPLGDRTVQLAQRTRYPWDGAVEIEVSSSGRFTLHVRVPGWCDAGAGIAVNGEVVSRPIAPGSYVPITRDWQMGDVVQLTLPMPVQPWQSHPLLHENAGRVALTRGPLLYCAEALDQPGTGIDGLSIDTQMPFECAFEPDKLGGVVTVRGTARRALRDAAWDNALYRRVEPAVPATPPAAGAVDFVAIPYFAWQNRGASAMAVWLPQVPRI